MKQIDKLIINSPYEEPKYYWHYDREHRSFEKREGRRPAGYVVATPDSRGFDDPGVFVPIELVNKIRPRVKSWRENNYSGVSGITRRLLHHWQDPEEREIRRFFFCQLETIETLIWLTEAPEAEKSGIECSIDQHTINICIGPAKEQGSKPDYGNFAFELRKKDLKHFPVLFEFDDNFKFSGLTILR